MITYRVGMAKDESPSKTTGRPLGPTGDAVRKNIAHLRGRMPVTELSARLEAVGRRIPPLGIRRIESGERRVDADDLVALALALDVSPATLLMPETDSPEAPVELVSVAEPVDAHSFWNWLVAAWPLDESGLSVMEFAANSWPKWRQKAPLLEFVGKSNYLNLKQSADSPDGSHGDS